MSIISQMFVKIQPGQRDTAIAAFKARNVLTECAQAIPGFLNARLLVPTDCPDTFCVEAEWQALSDISDWNAHPVRDAQANDLSHFLMQEPESRVFLRVG